MRISEIFASLQGEMVTSAIRGNDSYPELKTEFMQIIRQ